MLRVSYLEIYNEQIKDLLEPENTALTLREESGRGIHVVGSKEEVVANANQVFALMKKGEANRKTGKTGMNDYSRRSHAIFRMVIESREFVEGQRGSYGAVKVSQLNLVDLAGSERQRHTDAEGQRLKEGGYINQSLMVLGTVISRLSEGAKGFIPYRDSKLTRMLQASLGGNSRTAIIATVTPAFIHAQETLGTLRVGFLLTLVCQPRQVHSQQTPYQ